MASNFTFPPADGDQTTEKLVSPDKDIVMQAGGKVKPRPEGTVEHVVDLSETLESISAKYDATPSELMKINRLALRMVFPGQRIFIPIRPVVKEDDLKARSRDACSGS